MGEEYKELIQEFYRVYRLAKEKQNLRMNDHFGRDGNLIEIWEYDGEKRKRCVCKVREENEAECYRRAIELLKIYGKKEGKGYAEQKAG